MANTTTKISARIKDNSVSEIKENLDEFGCRTITQFVQLAVSEKLERFSIGNLIEESIGKQNSLNGTMVSVLKSVLTQEASNTQIVNQIATSLAKISAGFDALNKKN